MSVEGWHSQQGKTKKGTPILTNCTPFSPSSTMCFRADVFRCHYEISERQRGCSEQPRCGAGGVGGEEEREEQSRGWQRQRGAGGGMRPCRAAGLKGLAGLAGLAAVLLGGRGCRLGAGLLGLRRSMAAFNSVHPASFRTRAPH